MGVITMGYRAKKKTYRIIWEDGHDLAGLEIRVRGLSVGEMLDLTAAMPSQEDTAAPPAEVVDKMFTPFAAALVSWNLEDEDGQPVPATMAGLRSQELGLAMAMIMKWLSAVSDVDIPLPQPSSDTGTSEGASLALVGASKSLAS